MKNYYDYFGKDASLLKNKKLFLFDMDGTIYKDDVLFDGTIDFLNTIKYKDGKYVFLTNNSSKSVKDYIDKIRSLGIEVCYDDFCTSSQVTADYLSKHFSDRIIYCQGTKSFINELKENGIHVVTEVADDVDVVVVGFDTELTSEKIRNTCELLTRDLPFVATNRDLACPVSFGFIPDCGSICMMLRNATGKDPVFLGKPEKTMIQYISEKYHYDLNDIVIIGDRLYTDIMTGINAGVTSVCVLTGEASEEEIINSDIKPTFTFISVRNILDCIAE